MVIHGDGTYRIFADFDTAIIGVCGTASITMHRNYATHTMESTLALPSNTNIQPDEIHKYAKVHKTVKWNHATSATLPMVWLSVRATNGLSANVNWINGSLSL